MQKDSEEQDTLSSSIAPPGSTRGAVLQVPSLQTSESSWYSFDSSATQYVGSGHEMVSTSSKPNCVGAPSRLHVPAPVVWAGAPEKAREPRTSAIPHANPSRDRHERHTLLRLPPFHATIT